MAISAPTVKPGELMTFTPLTADGTAESGDPIKAQYNPSTIKYIESANYSENTIPYGGQQGKGNTMWNSSNAPRWSFTILINDFAVEGAIKQALAITSPGTGSSPIVAEKAQKLKDLLLKVNGDTHEPNYIEVSFGAIRFQANCINLSTEYKSFDQQGNPVAAEMQLEFLQLTPQELISASTNLMSPDVTHSVMIKEGDHLTAVSKKMYGKASFFTQIAKVNKLDSIRGIEPGTVLHLPPLDK
ncbi:MAG: uncharacterized protein K0S33_1742 [Bacteroidetes bacterium]|nr:uncharacterized protein [Bacteroidota bacterium]